MFDSITSQSWSTAVTWVALWSNSSHQSSTLVFGDLAAIKIGLTCDNQWCNSFVFSIQLCNDICNSLSFFDDLTGKLNWILISTKASTTCLGNIESLDSSSFSIFWENLLGICKAIITFQNSNLHLKVLHFFLEGFQLSSLLQIYSSSQFSNLGSGCV